jgi:hypothetical protein
VRLKRLPVWREINNRGPLKKLLVPVELAFDEKLRAKERLSVSPRTILDIPNTS